MEFGGRSHRHPSLKKRNFAPVQKFLVIQTAFIGDVVLATALLEKIHSHFPDAQIDFLVRKGNEALLTNHPYLHEVLVWDKKQYKLQNLWRLIRRIRRTKYDKVINVQRFAATGLLTVFSGAKETIGFDKNPLSFLFTRKIPHIVSAPAMLQPMHNSQQPAKPSPHGNFPIAPGPALHEIDRNQLLITTFTDDQPAKPRLYPSADDLNKVQPYKGRPYITISPASVWFTKQYPPEKWAAFLREVPASLTVYLLGAPSDNELCEQIRTLVGATERPPSAVHPSLPAGARQTADIINLSGQLSFLQSAALMKDATMNYVNDSAPMHFASAVNAPVTAVYCSTIPAFGFGPLSDVKFIVEIKEPLDCRPCGLHGYRACPRGHFHCAYNIQEAQLLQILTDSSLSNLPHII
jgi:ADP-heptose:LPS heptosyltransferase